MAKNPESKTVSDSLYGVIYFTMQHGKHLLYSAVFLASSSVLINNPSCRGRYSLWYLYKIVCLSHDFYIVIDRDFPVEKFIVRGLYDARLIIIDRTEYYACCFTNR